MTFKKTLGWMCLTAGVCLGSGCSSLFNDPLLEAYRAGEISQEEYERQSRAQEETLARSSPAYWELEQTISQSQTDLGPQATE